MSVTLDPNPVLVPRPSPLEEAIVGGSIIAVTYNPADERTAATADITLTFADGRDDVILTVTPQNGSAAIRRCADLLFAAKSAS